MVDILIKIKIVDPNPALLDHGVKPAGKKKYFNFNDCGISFGLINLRLLSSRVQYHTRPFST